MRNFNTPVASVAAMTACFLGASFKSAMAGDPLVQRIDHLVETVSQAPVNNGETVRLFVRQRVLSPVAQDAPTQDAILMIQGSLSSYHFELRSGLSGPSWAEALAKAGYDVFLMDQLGYGLSPKTPTGQSLQR